MQYHRPPRGLSHRVVTVMLAAPLFAAPVGCTSDCCKPDHDDRASANPSSASSQRQLENPSTGPSKNTAQASGATSPASKPATAVDDGKVLFDGKSLEGWRTSEFGGHGEPIVEEGNLILPMGEGLTGVTYHGELPDMNYEVSLEAMRTMGSDFFCGLTVPVNDTFASLIVGGWGGTVVGISSLDDQDASENETSSAHTFKRNQWYRVRLRVLPNKLQAWIDDEQVIDVDTTDKKIGLRADIDEAKPFGISTWQTAAAIRNIKVKELAKDGE